MKSCKSEKDTVHATCFTLYANPTLINTSNHMKTVRKAFRGDDDLPPISRDEDVNDDDKMVYCDKVT